MKNKLNKLIYFDEYRKINGIEQYLLHSGTSYDNPVMLFIHCSGLPESIYAYKFQKAWEEHFTIVHFDQRGAGKTFTKNPNEAPTIEKLVEDTHEIIKYLKEKYNKKKVIIFAHSLGTAIGSIYIQKYPEDVEYYIGTGQVINFKEGEQLVYKKMEELAQSKHDKKTLAKLEKYKNEGLEDDSLETYLNSGAKFNKLCMKYGLYENYCTFKNLKDFFMSPIFKWSDSTAMMKSGNLTLKLVEEVLKFNLRDYGNEYKVPVYYILGGKDWQTPPCLAQEYLKEAKAPRKKIYMVPNGGHAAVLSEIDEFNDIIEDIRKREIKGECVTY